MISKSLNLPSERPCPSLLWKTILVLQGSLPSLTKISKPRVILLAGAPCLLTNSICQQIEHQLFDLSIHHYTHLIHNHDLSYRRRVESARFRRVPAFQVRQSFQYSVSRHRSVSASTSRQAVPTWYPLHPSAPHLGRHNKSKEIKR